MAQQPTLTFIEQRDVDFYDDALGLDRTARVRGIRRQEILLEAYKASAILTSPSQKGISLPTRRFDEAMQFLTEWHENLGGTLPL